LLAEVAHLATAGDPRRVSALVARALAPRLVRHLAGALAWLANPFVAGNPADMLIANGAMIAFDAELGLGQVQAPTLVLGGSADPYYSEDLFRRTAAAIPGGQAAIFSGKAICTPRLPRPHPAPPWDSCWDGSRIFYAPAAVG
jgi:pimeloyl-ACP methyl ester carboxylesterase